MDAFRLEDAPDAVAIKVRQEVTDNKGRVVEWEVGGSPHSTNDGPLFLGCLPRPLVRASGGIEAIRNAALAPLAHGLGADAVALGHDTAGFHRASDPDPGGGCGAGIRVDMEHRSPLS